MSQTPPITDEDLLVAYAQGDPKAARQLTERVAPKVLGQARRMLGNMAEAEDVTQEVMMRLWKVAPEWRSGQAKVTTWLYRVTYNLCADILRGQRTVGLDNAPEQKDEARTVESALQHRTRHMALRKAIAQLPPRQAQAVSLRHLEGLSLPEIGQIMDITAEAAESLIARGKRALTAALAPQKDKLGAIE